MDPISTISGLVSAASFVDGSATASGAAVAAEVAQLLNKTNEIIGGLTTVASDLDADEAALVVVAARVTNNEASISTINDHQDATDLRVTALENENVPSRMTLYLTAQTTLSAYQMDAYGIVEAVFSVPGSVLLPCGDELPNVQPIVIVNNGAQTISVATDGSVTQVSWADQVHSVDDYLSLTTGESVTVIPVVNNDSQGTTRWAIIAGKTYADLITPE